MSNTPLSDNLDATRIEFRMESPPAYGDALALCRELEAKLAESRREAAEAQALLKEISEQTPEKPDYWSSCGQCDRNIDAAQDVLEGNTSALQSTIEQAVAPYREDAERLDYIQQQGTTVHLQFRQVNRGFDFVIGGQASTANRDVRAAIDAARNKTTKENVSEN